MLKMTKKTKKNLQDSKNSSIFALGFPGMIFEKTSRQPCKAWKPKEAMSVREMLERTERGQRLDVHTRFRAEGIPDNMYMAEYEEVRHPDGTIEKRMKPDVHGETFDHTPPDGVADIVDIIRLQEETNARKEEMKRRRQKTVANAGESAPAESPKDDPNPSPNEKPKQEA